VKVLAKNVVNNLDGFRVDVRHRSRRVARTDLSSIFPVIGDKIHLTSFLTDMYVGGSPVIGQLENSCGDVYL
jgi:hypothetical protein